VEDAVPNEGYEHSRGQAKGSVAIAGTLSTRPGDFILTHGSDLGSHLISIGQTFRFRGENRKYAHWNHAALIVGQKGEIIEALGPTPGVARGDLSKYAPREYTIVRITASPQDRDEEVEFAEACLKEKYGIATIISIALSLLTGTRFSFGFEGQQICSGLVARALERTTAIFKKEPSHIMPADLAKAYGVTPPPRREVSATSLP
jgi:hypothetical protein